MPTEEEYQQDKARRAELTQRAAEVTDTSKPTPTQEENDKLKLGLMHPDEKANPGNPEMPPVAVQQAFLASEKNADLKPGMPLPPEQKPPPGSEPPPLGESRRAGTPERSVPRTEPPKP